MRPARDLALVLLLTLRDVRFDSDSPYQLLDFHSKVFAMKTC